MANLFSEFTPSTKQDWLNKIEKELKGRPFEELQWKLKELGIVEPFYMAEDVHKNSSKSLYWFYAIYTFHYILYV